MNRLIVTIFSVLFLMSAPAFGKADSAELWNVSEKSGDVQMLRSGSQPVSLRSDSRVAAGDIIITGTTGRAMLTRSADYVLVAPNSRVRIPDAAPLGGVTRFIQQVGTLLFKVKHTGVPNFEVETPMLAAVVKGTTFTVIVGPDRSAVQVTEGQVEVTAISGGMKKLVMPGETVFVNNDMPDELVLASAQTIGNVIESGTDNAVRIGGTLPQSLSDLGSQTAGLVQGLTVLPVLGAEAAPPLIASATGNLQTVLNTVLGSETGSTSALATPEVVISTVTTPAITTPTVSLPAVTIPDVTVPSVSVPAVTVPPIAAPVTNLPVLPNVTTPPVTIPVVLPPAVLPPVVVPPVVVPPVTVPVPVPQINIPGL